MPESTETKPVQWIILLAVIGWSIVPYKAWTRAITGSEGFNLGDLFLVLFAAPALAIMAKQAVKDSLYFWILVMWAAVTLSLLKGMAAGEDFREMLRICRAEAFWVIVPLMRMAVTTEQRGRILIKGMAIVLIIAAISIPLYSFFPSFVPTDDEVASDRMENFSGFERVFTLGMWGVFAGSVFALGRMLLDKRSKVVSFVVCVILMGGLAFTFTRTFFLLIMIAGMYFLFRTWKTAKKNLVFAVAGLFLVITIASMNDAASAFLDSVANRTVGFLSVDLSEVDVGDTEGLGTIVWRLTEIDAGLSQMTGVGDYTLGVLGRQYTLVEGYSSSIPHISYFGLFYATGIIGTIAYLGLLIMAFHRLHQRVKLSSGHSLHWLFVSSFAAYALLLVGAFTAQLFHYPFGTATFALTVGSSEAFGVFLTNKETIVHEAA